MFLIDKSSRHIIIYALWIPQSLKITYKAPNVENVNFTCHCHGGSFNDLNFGRFHRGYKRLLSSLMPPLLKHSSRVTDSVAPNSIFNLGEIKQNKHQTTLQFNSALWFTHTTLYSRPPRPLLIVTRWQRPLPQLGIFGVIALTYE